MKNEKGITLIALIITIIVMLILVGVTINIAINGGLFVTANDATQKMERELEREELISVMVGAYDNNGYYQRANVVLPEGAVWCTKDGTPSSSGNYVKTESGEIFYVVPTDGSVLDEEPQNKTYSFTLNQLGTPEEISDSIAEFNCNTVWSISSINEDLSKNKNYALEDGHVFMVESNDSRFQDENDSTPNQEKEYTIFVAIENDHFCVVIYDLNGEDVITPENYSTFLATDGIGDITFTFKEVS